MAQAPPKDDKVKSDKDKESERGPVAKPGARPGKANFLIWRVLFELDVKYTPIKPIGALVCGLH